MNKPLVITVPNQKLLELTEKVASFGNELENQAKLMRQFLSHEDGIGLAANQIGFRNRVIIVEFIDSEKKQSIPFQVFINPEIVEFSNDKDCLEEGCLSVPKIELPLERSLKIKLRAQNLHGKRIRLTAKGLLSRIIQHEVDHLNGIVFTMRIKENLLKKYPELKKLKITFFGSGHFALPILEGLILLGLNVVIVTESPKPTGRNQELESTPIAKMAKIFNKKCFETQDLNSLSEDALNSDLLICADFGQKILKNILLSPKIAAINIHPSLLPKFRGAIPIQNAILSGDKETGVTIIKMSEEIDKGPILAQITSEILKDDNALILESRLSTLGLKLLYEVLPKIVKNELKDIPQDDNQATLTQRLKKTDGEINWQKPLDEIERQIRAFYPWPSSFTFVEDKRLIIHKAHLENDKLILETVQKEGGKPVSWKDYLRGFHGKKPLWFAKVEI